MDILFCFLKPYNISKLSFHFFSLFSTTEKPTFTKDCSVKIRLKIQQSNEKLQLVKNEFL